MKAYMQCVELAPLHAASFSTTCSLLVPGYVLWQIWSSILAEQDTSSSEQNVKACAVHDWR